MSHAEFLRAAWPGADEDCLSFVRNLWAFGAAQDWTLPLDARVANAVQLVPIKDADVRAIVALTARLTFAPASMESSHHRVFKSAGLSERTIHDAINVVGLFAFMNRFADGNGVTLDQAKHEFAVELFGADALEAHLAWGRSKIEP